GGTYNKTTTLANSGIVNTRGASSFTFPYFNLAVDVKITEWLDIRFGGSQRVFWVWSSGTDDGLDIAGTTSEARVEHSISTGVGINLPAGVSLDIQVDTGWWQRGPYLVSGDGGQFGMNAALSKDW
ncbi:MAG: hypothetical protein ACI9OJ_001399, partial [Myxococcota bacterium]